MGADPADPGRVATNFTDPPDIAIQIMSPGQSVISQVRRCTWSVTHGVPLALLVNPRDESVRLFRPGVGPVVLRGTDAVEVGDILPDFHLTVADLFSALSAE